MKKPKILLVTLCSAMAINANAISFSNWFGGVGDDGKASTSGNAAAQQSKTAKSQTGKLKFNLVNKTNTTLASAVLKDKTGKVLFTTTKGKSCAVNSVCTINIDQKLIANDRTFFFYDSNNKLASAYSFTNLDKNPTSIDAQADLASLGRYVFVKIQTSAPKITFTNLATSFYDVKDEKDPFTALGDYYLDFLGSSTNDSAVIKELVKQVGSNKPLLINPQSTRVVNQDKPMVKGTNFAKKGVQSVKGAQAEEGTGANPLCSAGFKSSMDFASSLLQFLAYAPIPGIDLFFKGAGAVADSACPSGGADYSANFTEINAKLDALANNLAATYAEIKEFRDEWRNAEIGTYIEGNLKGNTNAIETNIDSYYIGLLKIPGKDGKVHPSLESLVASYGGVDQAMKNKIFKEKIDAFVSNSAAIATAYKNMTNGSKPAKDFLDLRCKNYATMPKEIIATRLECNYRVLDIYTKLRVSADMVESSFADYKKTFGAEASGAFATLNTATIQSTNAAIDKFIPKNALYDPLAGLDKNLVANIKAIPACNTKDEKQKDITQITAWYGPNSPAGANPYITTTCFGNMEDTKVGTKVVDVFKDQITANYYYQEPNTKTVDAEVVNVLGVLVPKRFFKGNNSDSFAHTSWMNQSNPQVYASGDASSISGKYFVNLTTAINDQNSGYPSTTSPANNTILPSARAINVSRNNKEYTRNLYVPQFPSSVAGALDLKTSFQLADYWGSSSSNSGFSNNFYTYMRTLDENNIGYVWAIKNDMYREWQPSNDMFYFRASLLCMTNDCKVNSAASSLVFNKGVSLDADTTITFTGDEHLNTNSDSQVVNRWYDNTKLYVNGKTGF